MSQTTQPLWPAKWKMDIKYSVSYLQNISLMLGMKDWCQYWSILTWAKTAFTFWALLQAYVWYSCNESNKHGTCIFCHVFMALTLSMGLDSLHFICCLTTLSIPRVGSRCGLHRSTIPKLTSRNWETSGKNVDDEIRTNHLPKTCLKFYLQSTFSEKPSLLRTKDLKPLHSAGNGYEYYFKMHIVFPSQYMNWASGLAGRGLHAGSSSLSSLSPLALEASLDQCAMLSRAPSVMTLNFGFIWPRD
jgi:hypothetical protein